MKNLKKVLSLVLALAMALSLMTAAFAADAKDFADYDKVEYNEAVDVLVAAGVFNGKDGNKFAPNDTLTREEAAKIITYMMMGQKEADKLTTTVAPYADVAADRWSAGAIAWCTEKGILTGSNGKFYPTDKLTGLAFAKMCLVAMGYDAKIEKLEGSSWAINSATLAINNDLDKDMEKVSLSGSLTREQAALMAFNTMKADLVDYENRGTEIKLSDGTTVIVGASKAEAVKDTGDKKDTIAHDEILQFAEKYCRDLTLNGNKNTDDFCRPAHTWKFDKDEVGTYNDAPVLSYTAAVSPDDLEKDIDDAGYDFDTKTDETSITIYSNGAVDAKMTGTEVKNFLDGNADLGGNGVVVELYDANDDEVIDTVVMIWTYAAKVTDVVEDDEDTKKDERALEVEVYMSNRNATVTLDKDTAGFDAIYKNAEEDDIVLVTPKADDPDATAALTVALPEKISGEVTRVKDTKNFVIGGETYEYNAGMPASMKLATTAVDSEITAYVDANGYVVMTDDVAASDDYAVVVATTSGSWNGDADHQAKLLFPDGTVKAVDVKDDAKDLLNHVVTYTKNSKDVYTLTDKHTGGTDKVAEVGSKVMIDNGKAAMSLNGTNFVANSKTVFFFYDTDAKEYSAYTGIKNVPSIEGNAQGYTFHYYAAGNVMKAVYISAKGDLKTGTSSDVASYIYKTGSEKLVKDTELGDYYVVKAVVDGKADEIMVEAAKYGELSNGGNVVSKMTKDENNIITKVTVKTDGVDSNGDGYIIGSKAVVVEDEVINIGNNSYTYANDVVVFQYDKSADKFSKKSITSLDETYTLAAQVEDNVVVAIYYVVE